jgi:hypothetical protein
MFILWTPRVFVGGFFVIENTDEAQIDEIEQIDEIAQIAVPNVPYLTHC